MGIEEWTTNKEYYLRIDPKSRRNRYDILNNGSNIDNLCRDISSKISDRFWNFKVQGIYKDVKKVKLLSNSFDILVPELIWKADNMEMPTRKYLITIVLKPEYWGFSECHPTWIVNKKYSTPKFEIFEKNNRIANNVLGDILKNSCVEYRISTFFGINGSTRNPWRACIYVYVFLEDSLKEFYLSSHDRGLTKIGKKLRNDILPFFINECEENNVTVQDIRRSYSLHKQMERNAEIKFRAINEIPEIGNSHIAETRLYHLVKAHFPKAVREYSPRWLGRQRIDIYIPYRKIAIEYNGIQHYEAVEHFGGDEALIRRKKLDDKKRKLCKKNNVTLFEWKYDKQIDEQSVSELLAFLTTDVGNQ